MSALFPLHDLQSAVNSAPSLSTRARSSRHVLDESAVLVEMTAYVIGGAARSRAELMRSHPRPAK